MTVFVVLDALYPVGSPPRPRAILMLLRRFQDRCGWDLSLWIRMPASRIHWISRAINATSASASEIAITPPSPIATGRMAGSCRISRCIIFWHTCAMLVIAFVMISAVTDNATLVAMEIHGIEPHRGRKALIALFPAGGMLIAGNIPNIICGGPVRIGRYAWARIGVPLGLLLLVAYFFLTQGGRLTFRRVTCLVPRQVLVP